MTRELRRDVLLPMALVAAIAVLTSAGAAALLARMAPAIERIISENLYSLAAIDEMLALLGDDAGEPETGRRFSEALDRAEGNVTESSERPYITILEDAGPAALAGDPEARRRAVNALLVLAEINRAAVVRRDDEAQGLGYAGAWAAVFLGALSLAWAVIAVRRAGRRLIDPLDEIGAVLEAAHSGDTYRRCQRMPAPAEVETIMAGVDELLDARALRTFAEQPSLRAVVDRQILVHLLEGRPGPAWVITADGSVDAANRAGLEQLTGPDGADLRRELEAAAAGNTETVAVERIVGADRYLCEPR